MILSQIINRCHGNTRCIPVNIETRLEAGTTARCPKPSLPQQQFMSARHQSSQPLCLSCIPDEVPAEGWQQKVAQWPGPLDGALGSRFGLGPALTVKTFGK